MRAISVFSVRLLRNSFPVSLLIQALLLSAPAHGAPLPQTKALKLFSACAFENLKGDTTGKAPPEICLPASSPLPPAKETLAGTNAFPAPACSWQQVITASFLRLFPEYRLLPASGHGGSHQFFYRANPLIPLVQVSVFAETEPNAFALPADSDEHLPARILISEGLLTFIRNEQELAFVLAHEMSHIRNNHFAPELTGLLLTPGQLAHIAEVHRDWELQADLYAMTTLRDAGYRPSIAAKLLQRLPDAGRFEAAPLLRSHPEHDKRFAVINTEPAVQALSTQPVGDAPFDSAIERKVLQ